MSGEGLRGLIDSLPPWMKCMPGEEGPLLRQALADAQAEIDRLRSALAEALDHADYFSSALDGCGSGLEPLEEDRCDRLCDLRAVLAPNETT